jgi:class 3 adenylate cyclase
MWDQTGLRPGHDRVFGVPVRTVEEWRWIARLTGFLYVIGGGNLLVVFTPLHAPARHHAALITIEVALVMIGLLHFVLAASATDALISAGFVPFVLLNVYGGVGCIPVIMWLANPVAYSYGWASAVAVLLLSTYAAGPWHGAAAVGVISLGLGLILHADPSAYVAPLAQWLWVTQTLAAVVVLMGGMVARLDRLRREADTARCDLAEVNANLSAEVERQVTELERLGQLRRFLSGPVADALLADEDSRVLEAHRREIAVLFCDLRGFTAFSRSVEPEEVINVLDAYYQAVGERFDAHHATIGAYEGDGVMAFLNDPYRIEDPAHQVLELAQEISKVMDGLTAEWQRRDYDLGYGIGVAMGHATLGLVGFEGRTDYTALGNVVNLAARLCSQAGRGQIIVDRRIELEVRADVDLTPLQPVTLKGFAEPVPVFELVRT